MDEDQVVQESVEQQPESEKMLTQSQVNAIVQKEKQSAAARAKQQAEQEFQQRMEQMQAQKQQEQQGTAADNGDKQANADALYQQVQERFNREMQQKQMESEISQVAQNYLQKMNSGKDGYDDFDAVTADFDPTAFPQLVYLVSGIDNAADIIYELSKNPSKLVTLDNLALKSPRHAQAELNRLSQSIRDNKQAQTDANQQRTDAPLDRMQPSRVSSSDGRQSINDLRSQPWLRG